MGRTRPISRSRPNVRPRLGFGRATVPLGACVPLGGGCEPPTTVEGTLGFYIPVEIASRLADRMQEVDLSPRELDVLQRIAKGLSNREIGVELDLHESTVKTHVINILGKLGVSDRTLAVTTALQRGLLQLD